MPTISQLRCNSANFTAGRGGRTIDTIVIHYTGTTASAANNAKYFANTPNVGASAHYFVDGGGTIWQSVADGDRAWHAGNWDMNCRSIGIETASGGADFTDAEVSELAWLTQALMAKYGIKADHVIRHYDVTGKRCPAPYVDASKWAALKARITGAAAAKQATTTAKQAAPKPSTTQPPRANLLVDGQLGPLTVKALQKFLNVVRGAKLLEDGQLGPLTVKAWQTYLRDVAKSYSGYIDGQLGPMTAKAIQLRERSLGYYWYVTKSGSHANCSVDGQFGSYTVRAVQRALNDGKL